MIRKLESQEEGQIMSSHAKARRHTFVDQRPSSMPAREYPPREDFMVGGYFDEDAYFEQDTPEINTLWVQVAEEAAKDGFIGGEESKKLMQELS